MKILQSVIVKQVLTENSKDKLLHSYQEKKFLLQKECDQLRFELKKMERTKKFHPTSLNNYFEKEINSRQEKIKLVDFQIEQLSILPLGSELTEQNIQSVIDVEVGDDWNKIASERMIIVKDGFITEIR